MRSGDEDPHVHSALNGVDESAPDLSVRNEVGVLDPDRPPRPLDGHVVEQLRHGARVASRGRDRLGEQVAGRRGRRKLLRPVEDFSGRVNPVLREDGLELRDDGPLDPDHGLAPLIRIPGVARPPVVDTHASRESDTSVDRQDLPVRAVTDLVDRVDADGLVPLELHARLRHQLFELSGVRSPVVQHNADLDSLPGLRRECPGELRRDPALVEDEHFHVHAGARSPDRVEHRGEELVAVLEQNRTVLRNHLRSEDFERTPELGAVDSVVRLVGVTGSLAVSEDGAACRRQEREKERDRTRRRAREARKGFHPMYLCAVRSPADAPRLTEIRTTLR